MAVSLCFLPKWKYCLPVLLHVHNNPAIGISLVENLVQLADVAIPIVGILAIHIGVVKEQAESTPLASFGVLNHLHVGV